MTAARAATSRAMTIRARVFPMGTSLFSMGGGAIECGLGAARRRKPAFLIGRTALILEPMSQETVKKR